jgi:predicted PurR-regulated permease PerM
MLGLTIATLAMLAASVRVIGWILVAATFAGLLHPVVNGLERWMRHGLALIVVVLICVGVAGFIGYRVVDDINTQLHELQHALPKAARSIEHSDRFGKSAREIHLAAKVKEFVDELPARLRGGDTADALRSAATRGVAFLATGVLTIFFLIHGRRLLNGAANQLSPARQPRVREVGWSVYRRSWRYVAGSIGMAAIAGLLAYGIARALDLPGASPLAVWMALVDVIPVLGIVLGGLPLVLLAAATAPAWQTVLAGLVLALWQLFETLYLQPRVEMRSIHLGPFISIAIGMIGLEVYGIGGALIALVLAAVIGTLIDETLGQRPEIESGA